MSNKIIIGEYLRKNSNIYKIVPTSKNPRINYTEEGNFINGNNFQILGFSDKNLEIYNESILNTEKRFLPLGPWDNNTTIGRISSQSPETDGLTKVEIPFMEDYSIYKIKITGYEHELIQGEKI